MGRIPEQTAPRYPAHAIDPIQQVRFELSALDAYVAFVEPLLPYLEGREVIWVGDGYYQVASASQVETYQRLRDACPFRVVTRTCLVRNGAEVSVVRFGRVGANGLWRDDVYTTPAWRVYEAKLRIAVIRKLDRAAIEADHSAKVRAEIRKEELGRARFRLRSARHVLKCYRTVPYWQTAPDLAERIKDAEEAVREAEAGCASVGPA